MSYDHKLTKQNYIVQNSEALQNQMNLKIMTI